MSFKLWSESAMIMFASSSLPTTAATATLPNIDGGLCSSVSDSWASIRSSTRWATLDMRPSR